MNLIQIIKQASIEAVDQSSPMSIAYGTVTKTNPLEINIEQLKNSISGDMILLTSNVMDKNTEIKIGGSKIDTIIYNGLKTGEKVLLLRVDGGQKYIVLDRLVDE